LQAHAREVTELAQEGPMAMRRGMMTRMAMGQHGRHQGMMLPMQPRDQRSATPEHVP
jgi:hypothetical protein